MLIIYYFKTELSFKKNFDFEFYLFVPTLVASDLSDKAKPIV